MTCGVIVLLTVLTTTFVIQIKLSTCDSHECDSYIHPRNIYIFNMVLCIIGIAALFLYLILWSVNEKNEETVQMRQHKSKTDMLTKVFMWIFTFFITIFSMITILNVKEKMNHFKDLNSTGIINSTCKYKLSYDESIFNFKIVQIIFCLIQSMFLQLTFGIRFYRSILIKVVTFFIFWANASHFVLILVNAYTSSEDNSRNSYKECTLRQTTDWSVKQAYDVFAHFCKPMEGQYSVLCMLQIFEVSSIGVRYCCTSKQGNQKHKSQSTLEHANNEEKPLLSRHKTDDKDADSKNLNIDPLTNERPENACKDAENLSVNVDRTKALKELAFQRYTQMSGIAVIFLFIPDCATSIYSLSLNRINESYASSTTVRRLNGVETSYFVYHILLHAVMLLLFMFCFYMLYGSKTYFEKLTDGKIPSFKSSYFVISLSFLASFAFYGVNLTAYVLFTQSTPITILIVENLFSVLQISIQMFLILKVNELKKSKISSSFPRASMTHIFLIISVMNLGFWFASNFMGMSNYTKFVLTEILGDKTQHALCHIFIAFVCFFHFKSCAKFYELFRYQYDF
ncbi:uncharacterized protein LOC127707434 [Mytilus californianus]|uniref:uncharacterized protein LOC127707434 n=1 Tax=Mytilus californianus TaxID=6549 RepID=UPI002248365D|nr:uncharacterized protein LOC127707434 [Mytilus californianus]XP_052067914.1 uncharacterized protein LOC127707434 [Mytilus californianus]